eukprot:1191823-Prorocentrum_minimum.AAC.1
MTSFYGSSCANNGKGALDTPFGPSTTLFTCLAPPHTPPQGLANGFMPVSNVDRRESTPSVCRYILTTDQSDAGSAGIFSRQTNRTQEAQVYSHDGPLRRRKR